MRDIYYEDYIIGQIYKTSSAFIDAMAIRAFA